MVVRLPYDWIRGLTHCVLLTRHGVEDLDHHWLRKWIVACSAPSHWLYQWIIIKRALGNTFQWNFNCHSTVFIQDNALAKYRPFCLGFNMITRLPEDEAANDTTGDNINLLGKFYIKTIFKHCSMCTGCCPVIKLHRINDPTMFNTLRPRQNGRHFADDILKCIFLNENVWIPNNIPLKFVPKGPINNNPGLVQVMAWCRPGDKPLSEPMTVRLPTHICVTRP